MEGELVKKLSKRYNGWQVAQLDLRNDNPKLERLDRKIRVLRTNLQYINLGCPNNASPSPPAFRAKAHVI